MWIHRGCERGPTGSQDRSSLYVTREALIVREMNTTTNDINNLVDASGELLSEISNEKGAEIVALRERLKKSLAAIKQSIADGAQQATEQVKNAAGRR